MTTAARLHLEGLLTRQVFEFASDARRRFGSDDLVIIMDPISKTVELDANPRAAVVAALEASPLREKLSRPASELVDQLCTDLVPFWFVLLGPGEPQCVAVNGATLASGGST